MDFPQVNVKAEILIEKLSKLASEKKPVDLKDEMEHFFHRIEEEL